MLSHAVCAMHNWSGPVHIGQRMFSLVGDGVLATRCFSTQREALCWLTNPAHREALQGDAAGPDELHAAAADDDGCLAIRTHSSASCFGMDLRGCASALGMVREADVGTCIIRRFASTPSAWRWLVASVGKTLLDVVHTLPQAATDGVARRAPQLLPGPSSSAAPPVAGSRASCSRAPGARKDGTWSMLPAVRAAASSSSDDSTVISNYDVVELDCSGATPRHRSRPPTVGVRSSLGTALKRFKSSHVSSTEPPLNLRTPPSASLTIPSALSATTAAVGSRSSRPSRGSLLEEVLEAVPGFSAPSPATDPVPSRRRGHGSDSSSLFGRRGARDGAARCSGRMASVGAPQPRRRAASDGPRGVGVDYAVDAYGLAPIGRLAAAGLWGDVCEELFARINSAFVSGGPGAGKSTLLRKLRSFLAKRYAAEGEVVVLAPTGTSAKTASGMT